MEIQFRCPGCSQPIEVNDEFAGRTAACPYCARVAVVPVDSTFAPEHAVTARPVGVGGRGVDESPAIVIPPSAPYARGALLATILAVLLFGGCFSFLFVAIWRDINPTPGTILTQEQVTAALERISRANPWVALGPLGGLVCAVVGVALAIASLRGRSRGNWRASVSLLICGLIVLCVVSSALFQFFGGAA